ncbi:MAG: SDR family oxidoreductase, partial [Candidatus Afipia apatlaquensis]|nr:SDR family oxidoreductase [Candidatus Afipia apatlaquensis]
MRSGANAEGRREDWLASRQRDGIERRRFAAAEGPEIDRDAADATVAELRASGTAAVACIGDVSEEVGAEAVVREAYRGLGQLDILVNNAGAGGRHLGSLAENMSLDDWDIIVRTHLRSTFLCSKYAVPFMRER